MGAALLALIGCPSREGSPPTEPPPRTTETPAEPQAPETPASAQETLRTLAVESFRPVGIDEVRFHVRFADGREGTYIPSEARRPRRGQAEVAAARLATYLEIADRRVVLREFSLDEIEAALDESARPAWGELRSQMHVVEERVVGALGPWDTGVRDLRRTEPDRLQGMTARLLGMDVIAEDDLELYASLSQMVIFDHLLGVRRRDVVVDGEGTLRFESNGSAFPETVPFEQQRLLRRDLMRTRRFPRGLLERLRSLTGSELRRILASEPTLLTEPQLRGVENRRDAILSYTRSWIDQAGEERIVVFR